jgi:membrane protein required for colicin V production
MNWVSVVLLAFIGLLAWRAYRNGFIRELVSLCAIILALPIAGILYSRMYPKVEPIVDNPDLARLISFLSIFLGVVIAGQVLAYLLRSTVEMLNLGALDSLAGGVFGALKAILIAQAILIALVLFPKPDFRDDIDQSPVARGLLRSAFFALSLLPSRFDDGVDRFFDTAAEVTGRDPRTPSAGP